jgi:carbon storage regulator
MLVLSRKVGEKLIIGDSIEILVVRVAGNRVRLGIEAPRQVHVVRQELEAAGRGGERALAGAAPLPR